MRGSNQEGCHAACTGWELRCPGRSHATTAVALPWRLARCACCAGSIGRLSKLTMLVDLCSKEAPYPTFGAWSPAFKEAQVGRDGAAAGPH